MGKRKTCFVICPIGSDGSQTRTRSDQVYKHLITKGLAEFDFDIVRADKIHNAGIITSQIVQHLVNDDLVVADLTERNPNVFYELAIRHMIRKPFVQLVGPGESLPFDVHSVRTIPFDLANPDSLEAAQLALANSWRALESSPTDIQTPISVALDRSELERSENVVQRSLAELIDKVSAMSQDLQLLGTYLTNNLVVPSISSILAGLNPDASKTKHIFDSSVSKRGGLLDPKLDDDNNG